MANIAVRKDDNRNAPLAPTWESRWEPFRMMRDLLGWDPFREMTTMPAQGLGAFNPAFEVKETKDGFTFKADVPGMKESDLQVTLTGHRLTIRGKREAEKKEQTDTFYTYERSYGDFMRAFTLPDGVDGNSVNADLKDGVLSVSLSKRPEAQPKKVEIQSPAKRS